MRKIGLKTEKEKMMTIAVTLPPSLVVKLDKRIDKYESRSSVLREILIRELGE